ncbi:MAG: tetratricopeptide repeat protein [Betaproteobacteria bacterium]
MSSKPTNKSYLQRPLKPLPADALLQFNHALNYFQSGELSIAKIMCEDVVLKHPKNVDALNLLSVIYSHNKQLDLSLTTINRAIAIYPMHPDFFFNRGVTQEHLLQFDDAISSFQKALQLRPKYPDALYALGYIYYRKGQLNLSKNAIDKAILYQPNFANAFLTKAFIHLIEGDFQEGFKLYQWRWKSESHDSQQRIFQQPILTSQTEIAGKRIFIYGEQGLGDTIQFCRYVTHLSDQGAQVYLESPGSLLPILSSLKGCHQLVLQGDAAPDFDYHAPLLELPAICQTEIHTIPYTQAYLTNGPDKLMSWNKKLGPKTKPRIGLVWSGNAQQANDINRSFLLSDLLPLLPEGFEYFSLQKEVREEDAQSLQSSTKIQHLGNELLDFSDTGALCELMDLVISVDTSVAHLSAALGKRTWVMLSLVPDWRWLLEIKDNPWYESVTVYRQTNFRDWTQVFSDIRKDLLLLV